MRSIWRLRAWLATASSPTVGLLMGTFFGLFITIVGGLMHGAWVGAITVGLIGGAVVGAFMGPWVVRMNRRVLGDLADLPSVDLPVVLRAAARGPVPADPGQRAAALVLARRRHAELMQTHRWWVVIYSVLVPLAVGLSIVTTPWWLLAALLAVAVLVLLFVAPRFYQRRVDQLERAG